MIGDVSTVSEGIALMSEAYPAVMGVLIVLGRLAGKVVDANPGIGIEWLRLRHERRRKSQ